MLQELKEYLQSNKDKVIYLSLHPEQGNTIISKEAVNRCVVSISGIEKEFTGIAEKDYDKLVNKYDWREVKKDWSEVYDETQYFNED